MPKCLELKPDVNITGLGVIQNEIVHVFMRVRQYALYVNAQRYIQSEVEYKWEI